MDGIAKTDKQSLQNADGRTLFAGRIRWWTLPLTLGLLLFLAISSLGVDYTNNYPILIGYIIILGVIVVLLSTILHSILRRVGLGRYTICGEIIFVVVALMLLYYYLQVFEPYWSVQEYQMTKASGFNKFKPYLVATGTKTNGQFHTLIINNVGESITINPTKVTVTDLAPDGNGVPCINVTLWSPCDKRLCEDTGPVDIPSKDNFELRADCPSLEYGESYVHKMIISYRAGRGGDAKDYTEMGEIRGIPNDI